MKDFNSETALALIRLVVPTLASAAAMFGWSVDSDLAINIATTLLALITLVWSWWRNNNLTEAAREAQRLLDEIKQTAKADADEAKAAEAQR